MDWNKHHRIARTALKMQMLSFDSVSEILRDLGARAAAGEEVSVELWSEAGWVSPGQLETLLEAIDDPSAVDADSEQPDDASGGELAEELAVPEGEGLLEDTEPIPSQMRPLGDIDTEGFEDVSTATIEMSDRRDDDPGADAQVGDTVQEGEDIAVADTFRDGDADIAFEQTGLYRADVHASAIELLDDPHRYRRGRELGRGGGGRVIEAYDRCLKRKVAMKIHDHRVDDDQAVRRFLSEAQAACQLEHPNIMPVYDGGILEDGRVYYTMLLTRDHSLRDVLDELRNEDPQVVEDYSLSRLVAILKQVSQALEYAHDRGVIHRDIKPGNIMLGEFGEVLVMDWGLAEVSGEQIKTELSEKGEEVVEGGYTLGTPSYMAPEQARGRLEQVDERSDVYALGAVLYEMLVLEPPFDAEGPLETMRQVADGELVAPRERIDHDLWEIPEELERICTTALQRSRDDRWASAGEMFEQLEQYLDGIRPRRARQRLRRGREAAERYHDSNAHIERLTEKIDELVEEIAPWESINKKRRLWRLEDEREELRIQRARAFSEAVTGFQQALAYDPDCEPAREALAQLYWQRYCEAEATGDEFEQIYFDALIEDTGEDEYVERLSRQVEVGVRSRPSGAEVTLFPYEELDRRLVVADERALGTTPLRISELEVGRYLLMLDADGKAMVRAPLLARRGEAVDMRISLPAEEAVEEGFVFVPGGPCFVGGDPEAINPKPRRKIDVSSFFCATYPVTFRQYLEFLDALPEQQARQRAPRRRSGQGLLVAFDEQTGRWKPNPFFSRRRSGDDPRAESLWELPVVGITGHDARAYCQWRSERDGRSFRLPTEAEWEKAGRGVDGRLFPWGDHFDATFCKMQQSRSHQSRLEPVGSFVDDASPYGIRDLSGGVHAWCEAGTEEKMPIRGGAWDQGERACRLASTRTISADRCARNIGMRLVYDIEFDDGWTGTQRVQRPDQLPE